MNDSTRNTFASYGLDILMRSALLVLYEETDVRVRKQIYPHRSRTLRQDEVRERLGIPKIDYSSDPARHNALIFGILMHLQHEKLAYHYSGYGWQITEEGKSLIENSGLS